MAEPGLRRLRDNIGHPLVHTARPAFDRAGDDSRPMPGQRRGTAGTGYDRDDAEPAANQRSDVSKMAIKGALGVSYGKYALDSFRTWKKLPEAARRGRAVRALFEAATGNPTTAIVDPTAPRHAARGLATFTRFDAGMYRTSMVLGLSMAAANFGSGVPNAAEALFNDGPKGLVDTRAGRSGLSQTIGGAVILGIARKALLDTRAKDVKGFWPTVASVTASARLSRPWVVFGVGLGTGASTLFNEAGLFDVANKDDPRSFAKKMGDAGGNIAEAGRDIAGTPARLARGVGDALGL